MQTLLFETMLNNHKTNIESNKNLKTSRKQYELTKTVLIP